MSTNAAPLDDQVYYDPYMREIVKNPHPVYTRLREEAPLYYNEKYQFYAVSQYEDVRRGLADNETFISGKGGILEVIAAGMEFDPGVFIFEDPPVHTFHRTAVQRLFTPRRMLNLEAKVREITVQVLDRLVGRDEFDFIADIGSEVPMRVIGTLLGIPEDDLEAVRENADSKMRTAEGGQMDASSFEQNESFEAYIDWRMQNPSDDVMTELLSIEVTDETGTTRKLTREELLSFCNVLAGAGNETTNKLIGWMGKTLAENPEQRKLLVQDPALINQAIEEILRYEPPGPHIARYVAKDTEFHGQTVPAGSSILFIVASANRDPRAFEDPDRFDIERDRKSAHCTFGYGIHTCIGQVLARLEGRIVLEELLKRFPDWQVDLDNAELLSTSTVRGWATLPAYINQAGAEKIKARAAAKAAAEADHSSAPASIDGDWTVTVKGPTGPMDSELALLISNGQLSGTQTGEGTTTPVHDISYENGNVTWVNKIKKPMKMTLTFSGKVQGDTISGKVKAGFMGSFPFTAVKQ